MSIANIDEHTFLTMDSSPLIQHTSHPDLQRISSETVIHLNEKSSSIFSSFS